MLYTIPDYYHEFSCVAGKCEDTCCAGWQIVADEASLEKYKNEVCVCDCPDISNDACISDNNEDDELVNINTANIDELMDIKGIGRSKAKAIIEYRDKNGNFNSIDDIKNVDGIGDSLFEKIKMYIKV